MKEKSFLKQRLFQRLAFWDANVENCNKQHFNKVERLFCRRFDWFRVPVKM